MDLSHDLLTVADGLEIVALRRRNGEVTPALHGLQRPLARQAPGGNAELRADVHWHLSAAECPQAPAAGDVIVDPQGRQWTVLECDAMALASRWVCTCCNLVVAYALDEVVTIDQADYYKSADGAVLPQWYTWRTGIAARITPQPLPPAVAGQLPGPRRFNVIVGQQLNLGRRHRIRTADGRAYHVIGYRPAQQPGQLDLAEAEEA